MMIYLILCILSGFVGAYIITRYGYRFGLIDKPKPRSSHSKLTVKGGGIGILFAFMLGVFIWDLPVRLWIPAIFVSLLSLIGDYRELSFKIRLFVQIASAAVFSSSYVLSKFLSELPIEIIILLIFMGILFITTTANYYNFMDGINGIAGVTGLIAFTGLGLAGLIGNKEPTWIVVAFGIAAACLGFLPLNFPKARVFMGDVGSVLLGFLFASWVLWFSESIFEFIVLTSFLFPFYADELSTLIVRIKDGDSLTKAHRRHIYQILANQAGFSHAVVTLSYGFIQIVVAFLAWMMMREGLILLLSVLIFITAIFFLGGMYIRRRWEFSESYYG